MFWVPSDESLDQYYTFFVSLADLFQIYSTFNKLHKQNPKADVQNYFLTCTIKTGSHGDTKCKHLKKF